MNYMEEFERDFREVLSKGDFEATVQWVKDRVLQSYRNGRRGPKAAQGGRRQSKAGQNS